MGRVILNQRRFGGYRCRVSMMSRANMRFSLFMMGWSRMMAIGMGAKLFYSTAFRNTLSSFETVVVVGANAGWTGAVSVMDRFFNGLTHKRCRTLGMAGSRLRG